MLNNVYMLFKNKNLIEIQMRKKTQAHGADDYVCLCSIGKVRMSSTERPH